MRQCIRTADEPPGEILRTLRQYYCWDGDPDAWCVRNRYTGRRVNTWTILCRGYELRTLDVARYLQDFTWPWESDPDYRDYTPPEIFR
jgi:hypothetical protein